MPRRAILLTRSQHILSLPPSDRRVHILDHLLSFEPSCFSFFFLPIICLQAHLPAASPASSLSTSPYTHATRPREDDDDPHIGDRLSCGEGENFDKLV